MGAVQKFKMGQRKEKEVCISFGPHSPGFHTFLDGVDFLRLNSPTPLVFTENIVNNNVSFVSVSQSACAEYSIYDTLYSLHCIESLILKKKNKKTETLILYET